MLFITVQPACWSLTSYRLEVDYLYGFDGWLLKINGQEFPGSYIRAGTYTITPDQETDIDDFTDNTGKFNRNVLPAKATKIEFEVKPLRLYQMQQIMSLIPGIDSDNEVQIEYWNPRAMKYQSGRAYIPDISFEPYMVYKEIGDILFNPFRVALIEYGEER